jgi:hypothetical protein
MSARYFKLTMDLGNDALQTPEDVVVVLRAIANKLEGGAEYGAIHDANGNNVGSFCGDFEDDES